MNKKLNVYLFQQETKEFELFSLAANSVKEVCSLVVLQKGESFITELLSTPHFFILACSDNKYEPTVLPPAVISTDFGEYDQLYLIPDISGEAVIGGVVAYYAAFASAAALTAAGVAAATAVAVAQVIGFVASMVVSIGLSVGLSMLSNLLSPSASISAGSDPATIQQQNTSNLFNGNAVVREQGGPVPFGFGRPFHGGTLVSSGIYSEDISA